MGLSEIKRLTLILLSISTLLGAKESNPAQFVNPFIGTNGHGHTFPGAVVPFGMVQLSPDTRLTGWDGCSGYHYSDQVIYGFSHTHLSGTGVADLCDILLMPIAREGLWLNTAYASPFQKKSEKAEPGYYTVRLDKPNVLVELTTTPRVGLHRYTFAGDSTRHLILDLEHRDPVLDSWIKVISPTEVHGYRRSSSWAKDQRLYFVMHFSEPMQKITHQGPDGLSGKKVKAIFRFSPSPKPLLVKVALSAVEPSGALKNLVQELPGWDFTAVQKQARKRWNQELGKIEVSGGTPEQMTTFYSALYHCMIHPSLWSDIDGRYRAHDQTIHQADGSNIYSVFSLWDTFRTLHPLLTIIDTRRSQEFIHTFLSFYQTGGLLPVWELAGNETFCMIGYHSVPVILDAWVKGICGFDAQLALQAMKTSANRDHFGLDAYKAYGHIAGDMDHEGVSKTLEYTYDDWCIAQMAKALGKTDDYNRYIKRAQYYKNIFDHQTGFMRPRLNGGWKSPFDPSEVDFNFTEANSWQYSFFVPQDISGLITLFGGFDKMEQKLDQLFTSDKQLSGRQQSDITGLIGQYAHGNEPSHHMAYLYAFLGKPWKTQARVRQIMDSLYSPEPDGLCGNEDCGQMSAWLVMSALGFYPVTPGLPEYVIGTPWFPQAVIHLENGRTFTITAPEVSKNRFTIQNAMLNGRPHTRSVLSHQAIMAGGRLDFTMGAEPNLSWASRETDRPQSAIKTEAIVEIPAISAPSPTFSDSLIVDISTVSPRYKLFYTLDGSDPDSSSLPYRNPITLKQTTTVKALAVNSQGQQSQTVSALFHQVHSEYKIDIHSQVNHQYTAGGPEGLIDGLRGHANFRLGGWQGYQDQDFEAVIDLGKVKKIKRLAAGFLQDCGSWIMMPKAVEFWISGNGTEFTLAGKVIHNIADNEMNPVLLDIELKLAESARHIKIIARNYGPLPDWHLGAGHPAFIFIDEIIIE